MIPVQCRTNSELYTYAVVHVCCRHHRKARCIVERVIGVLKRRFLCLHNENRMRVENVPNVIMACCVLHNIAVRSGILGRREIEEFDLADFLLPDDDADDDDDDAQGNEFETRDHIIEQIFANF